jgi:hypothetical protein
LQDTDSSFVEAAPPDPGIRCGANAWCASGTVCCQKLGLAGWFMPSPPCDASGACGAFSEFACDTARECTGDAGAGAVGGPDSLTCCATRESSEQEFQGSRCVASAACTPAPFAVPLCAPDDVAACPTGGSCIASDGGDLPPGYFACR